MKSIARIQTYSKGKPLGIDVQVDIDRELSQDESYEVMRMAEKVLQMLNNNTVLNSQEHKDELAKEKEELLGCFPEQIYVKEIPNGYHESYLKPWFEVTTKKGIIIIGWRKRVIVIDWSKSDITQKAEDIFGSELVDGYKPTMYDKLIHAWGYDKAKQYIQKLLS